MNSLPLFDAVSPSLPRKRGQVPKTSVLAYQATDAAGRVRRVVDLLSLWHEVMTDADRMPTSAELYELALYRAEDWAAGWNATQCTLYVRRGLSDAKAKGLVVQGEKRICRVAGTLAVTWKVAHR